ncbi:MAG: energy-coupling factor transporter ATPase [Erysipelotrichaceae bacterium]|jgi:energy-coupling factor transport system ATP-binding protein|nr:energy-coupling factor transporter ATPase [Erysipelotrichaceae bacterium]MBQ3962537.1 energy-coupling factor transporter ATPase [Erysipelotrichaceae bacterium]MBR3005852.1 energy-coupling factor transporter ATPase [Erysipelotrichaceae bacterium]MBR6723983.1 energy-coupling factor transporter ATPase [Erysipelotrichaceae bacterium]
MSLIEVKNVSFSYNETKKAVDDVSFEVEQGSYVTVIGHNGSGKSTLAKLIAGLLPIKEGKIIIDGLEVNEENIGKIRTKLGIVFQNPDNQFIGSTVKDDIAFGLENKQVKQEDMDGIINEYADKVGLHDFLNYEPQNLSGGQKQRVAIAGILAMKPSILIFDEATSMLDPKGKKEIKKLMYDLAGGDDITIISITHDIEEVLQSDDCVVLNKGKLFMHDTPEKVFMHADKLRQIELDVPFIEKVREVFGKKKIKLKADDLEGMVDELCRSSSKR